MLAEDAAPTIRWATTKRIEKEPGLRLVDGGIQHFRQGDPYWDYDAGAESTAVLPFFRVNLFIEIRALMIRMESRFDLPIPFELRHLHNEIDEIAEQAKQIKSEVLVGGKPMLVGVDKVLQGNGMRGNWAKYG